MASRAAATTTSRSDRPLGPGAFAARRAIALAAAIALGGCTYTVHLLSEPDGATVHLPDGSTVLTPADATFGRGAQPVVVEAEGYRDLELDMNRTEGRFLRRLEVALSRSHRREVTFLLIEEHPPTGSAAAGAAAAPSTR